jgi:hypothetical protein
MRHPIAKALSLAQVAAREDEIADLSALSSVQGPEEGIGTIGGIGLSSDASVAGAARHVVGICAAHSPVT